MEHFTLWGVCGFDFITLNARFVDYFPWITQSIKGINKKKTGNLHQ